MEQNDNACLGDDIFRHASVEQINNVERLVDCCLGMCGLHWTQVVLGLPFFSHRKPLLHSCSPRCERFPCPTSSRQNVCTGSILCYACVRIGHIRNMRGIPLRKCCAFPKFTKCVCGVDRKFFVFEQTKSFLCCCSSFAVTFHSPNACILLARLRW